jgi:hypothetical protein
MTLPKRKSHVVYEVRFSFLREDGERTLASPRAKIFRIEQASSRVGSGRRSRWFTATPMRCRAAPPKALPRYAAHRDHQSLDPAHAISAADLAVSGARSTCRSFATRVVGRVGQRTLRWPTPRPRSAQCRAVRRATRPSGRCWRSLRRRTGRLQGKADIWVSVGRPRRARSRPTNRRARVCRAARVQ